VGPRLKEVSCKVIFPVLRQAEKKKGAAEILTRGTPYSLAHLRNGKERVSWDEFLLIMRNAREIWTKRS